MSAYNYKLKNDVIIPPIMLGTFNLIGEKAIEIIAKAYEAGYRGFDCARFYKNEKDLGIAIKKSGINREKIFIQTKVDYTQENASFDVVKDFEVTLNNFQTDYIDAYLIHWPVFSIFEKTWRALEDLYFQGKVRAIGVCNFRIEHFKILESSARVFPMIAQFERHPLRQQPELIKYCLEHGIQPEAYSPLAVSKSGLVNNSVLNSVAKNHNCSVQQIALAWNIQSGVIPLPRTSNPDRLKENILSREITLSDEEMIAINQNGHYFRALTEQLEFPGYWDQIHKVDVDYYLR